MSTFICVYLVCAIISLDGVFPNLAVFKITYIRSMYGKFDKFRFIRKIYVRLYITFFLKCYMLIHINIPLNVSDMWSLSRWIYFCCVSYMFKMFFFLEWWMKVDGMFQYRYIEYEVWEIFRYIIRRVMCFVLWMKDFIVRARTYEKSFFKCVPQTNY